MDEKQSIDEVTFDSEKKDKVVSLFKFIGELNKLKQKLVLRVADYPWWRPISTLPNDPDNIKIYYRDRVEEEDADAVATVLLSVHKPEFELCPEPDNSFAEWLEADWNNYHNKAVVKEFIYVPLNNMNLPEQLSKEQNRRIDEAAQTYKVLFSDDPKRVETYEDWLITRTEWVNKQLLLEQTRNTFTEFYQICIDLERDAETLELLVADGFIRDRLTPNIDHPILTRRVKIRYDAVENTIYIEDTDVETELYTVMLQNMENISLTSINHLRDDLRQSDYHPLDRTELPNFFKAFIHQLSAESIYSELGIPDGWKDKERLLLYRNPCYILRKRMDGALKAIEQIIDHVEKTGEVPAPICDIVEGGKIDVPEDSDEITIEEQLAAVGGESVDILLSKEANKEQLEIARRIERYNAVLVQGPPGTGKTHTIANLMGHFLAQGKSVLVTSHTQKALSVLKEKVAPGLQSLCVSMLDDSNVDMEKSIDGITSYMAQTTSFELKKDMDALELERKKIISDLASIRKKLFAIINQECNCIVYDGDDVSPSAAASFVQANSEKLSYIPGAVRLYSPLPLSFSELTELYQSNVAISALDEAELERNIPNPSEILTPSYFEQRCEILASASARLQSIEAEKQWHIQNLLAKGKVIIALPQGHLTLDYSAADAFEQLKSYIATFPNIEEWMLHCAVDGKRGSSYEQLWTRLIEQIQQACVIAEKVVSEEFGKDIKINNQQPDFADAVKQLQSKLAKDGKAGKLALLFNKQLETALTGATINNHELQSAEECQVILDVIALKRARDECAICWNNLMASHGIPQFYELDAIAPESVAANYIPLIWRYLGWFKSEYETLTTLMKAVNLPCDILFQHNSLDSDVIYARKILSAVRSELSAICEIFDIVQSIADAQGSLNAASSILQSGKRISSEECIKLASAIAEQDTNAYRDAYAVLESTYGKSALRLKREGYLNRLAPIAPEWAEAIRSRSGIHGGETVPADIEDAWKWKQYYGIINEIIAEPFPELQKKSLALSKEYREVTARFAEKSAWYHLLRRTEHDISMKQVLIGWKQTVKKIGKGTGRNAPMYHAEARRLMVKCQNAVPCWIMPIGKALESLNPQTNRFDIIIIDEASQSDISSLAILYMGKKLVIVGDDKQVSPMAVGVEVDKMTALKDMYITGKIPNSHLYDAKTSIYDIAATTFQPLMLREHFRCVPEIIGFSNWLSYDFQIKPLRDCSNSVLLPAVVNYRVADGVREGKTNPKEAKAVVALMQACMAQPEYDGKTFGVISLLGDEQVKKLQAEIYKHIDARVCSERKILCGNASNFQGDERDVVFLSVVDSANGNGPIAKQGYGVDDAFRKRYNVAVSRAKDQLWVVDSLDPANDLKPGDIRKMLIDYSINPDSFAVMNAEIEEKSDSPFESSVARYLVAKGYHLVQQWKVGAYRLDMVAVCGQKKVAIECDGERYHSGEDKIREDMERQTILERLGWQFIRIRGSEFYRDSEATMQRVIRELSEYGIEPEESAAAQEKADRESELLQRVKRQAYALLHEDNNTATLDTGTVAAALDPKNDVIGAEPMKPNEVQGTENKQMTLTETEDASIGDKELITFLQTNNIDYIDKRANGGSLWIIGGFELNGFAQKAKEWGYVFHFKKEGGRATKNRPGWWTK